jgi:hypothetical protein
MTRTRTRVLTAAAVTTVIAAATVTTLALRDDPSPARPALAVRAADGTLVDATEPEPADEPFRASRTADPTNGHALVLEALENLRAAEKFSFTQQLVGGTRPGTITGDVDLAADGSEVPRLRSRYATTSGDAPVTVEQVVIGDELFTKDVKTGSYKQKSAQSLKRKGKGKKGGGSTPAVDVVDPVMSVLDPLDELPASAFGTPTAVGTDAVSVVVTLAADAGPAATFTFVINLADHTIRSVGYARGGDRADYTLTPDSTLVITAPTTP